MGESCSFRLPYVFVVFCIFIVNIVISRISFEGGTLVLIASVLGHCLSFTYFIYYSICCTTYRFHLSCHSAYHFIL